MSKYQQFFKADADRLHPEGCRCPDRSGDCAWCRVYYGGSEASEKQAPTHTIDGKALGGSPDSSTLTYYMFAEGNSLEELRDTCMVSEVDQDGEDLRNYGYFDMPAFLEDKVEQALAAVMRRVA